MIRIENVSREYHSAEGRVKALSDVSLRIPRGEFLSLIGPSGCGKSTLINILAGFLKPTSGACYLDNRQIRKPGPERGVVFQENSLFPWMSVEENLKLALGRDSKAVEHYLETVGLRGFDKAYPHELSGGMKQKVSIARTLAMSPDVILMDEPFSSLDEQTRFALDRELKSIWEREGKTIVFVTHSIEEAIFLSNRVVLFTKRPGRIQKEWLIRDNRMIELDKTGASALREEIKNNMELCCLECTI